MRRENLFCFIKCINSRFEGKYIAGVKYERKRVMIHRLCAEGVSPVFEGIKITLQEDVDTLYQRLGNTDYGFYHGAMKEATKLLKQKLSYSPEMRKLFTRHQLEDIEQEREKITGKIWHHCEELSEQGYPIMQLIDERPHTLCKHTGCSYTWNPKHYK